MVVNQYPINTSVNVFYNPAKPTEAVLERSTGSGSKGLMIGGVVLVILSIALGFPILMSAFG